MVRATSSSSSSARPALLIETLEGVWHQGCPSTQPARSLAPYRRLRFCRRLNEFHWNLTKQETLKLLVQHQHADFKGACQLRAQGKRSLHSIVHSLVTVKTWKKCPASGAESAQIGTHSGLLTVDTSHVYRSLAPVARPSLVPASSSVGISVCHGLGSHL